MWPSSASVSSPKLLVYLHHARDVGEERGGRFADDTVAQQRLREMRDELVFRHRAEVLPVDPLELRLVELCGQCRDAVQIES